MERKEKRIEKRYGKLVWINGEWLFIPNFIVDSDEYACWLSRHSFSYPRQGYEFEDLLPLGHTVTVVDTHQMIVGRREFNWTDEEAVNVILNIKQDKIDELKKRVIDKELFAALDSGNKERILALGPAALYMILFGVCEEDVYCVKTLMGKKNYLEDVYAGTVKRILKSGPDRNGRYFDLGGSLFLDGSLLMNDVIIENIW